MSVKSTLLKSIQLERNLKAYKIDQEKKEVFAKFERVWGTHLAEHFLSKYEDAESLIWALDGDNLKLFIDNF